MPRVPPTHAAGPAASPRVAARAVVGGLALAWLVVGLLGAVRYVHGYVLFRGFPPPRTPRGVPAGRRLTVRFHSAALGAERSIDVYLPPGYATEAAAGRRFPVLYLLHGSPGQPERFFLAGDVAVRADTLLAERRIGPMIVAAPLGRGPAGQADTGWADAGAGAQERYVLDVVRFIDRRFATLPDRGHRVLAGNSEGGYGAANVALHHLGTFGAFQSWSGYFRVTPDGPFAGATPAQLDDNSPATYVGRLGASVRRLGLRAYLYQGAGDRAGTAALRSFAGELAAAGTQVGVGVFPGGHDWGLWRRQMPHMLELAGRWFATAPPQRGSRP